MAGPQVACSSCGLLSVPTADALCPACGMPVTVDVREALPPGRRRLPSVEELAARLQQQQTRRKAKGWGAPLSPAWVVGLVAGLLLFRWVLRLWLAR